MKTSTKGGGEGGGREEGGGRREEGGGRREKGGGRREEKERTEKVTRGRGELERGSYLIVG